MPELPEVEVTRRGIEPWLKTAVITGARHDQDPLRAPYAGDMAALRGAVVTGVRRRAKYLLIDTTAGILLIHLGMTGRLYRGHPGERVQTHDHFVMGLNDGTELRFNDSRRFGLVKFFPRGTDPLQDELCRDLGPEPLSPAFTATELRSRLAGRRVAIKAALMNQRIVAGIGNIYASEILFAAGIRPQRPAGTVTADECEALVRHTAAILTEAIARGGTTISDFRAPDGHPGYFERELRVYGRQGRPCPRCGTSIVCETLGQRSTFFCPNPACQR